MWTINYFNCPSVLEPPTVLRGVEALSVWMFEVLTMIPVSCLLHLRSSHLSVLQQQPSFFQIMITQHNITLGRDGGAQMQHSKMRRSTLCPFTLLKLCHSATMRKSELTTKEQFQLLSSHSFFSSLHPLNFTQSASLAHNNTALTSPVTFMHVSQQPHTLRFIYSHSSGNTFSVMASNAAVSSPSLSLSSPPLQRLIGFLVSGR